MLRTELVKLVRMACTRMTIHMTFSNKFNLNSCYKNMKFNIKQREKSKLIAEQHSVLDLVLASTIYKLQDLNSQHDIEIFQFK